MTAPAHKVDADLRGTEARGELLSGELLEALFVHDAVGGGGDCLAGFSFEGRVDDVELLDDLPCEGVASFAGDALWGVADLPFDALRFGLRRLSELLLGGWRAGCLLGWIDAPRGSRWNVCGIWAFSHGLLHRLHRTHRIRAIVGSQLGSRL